MMASDSRDSIINYRHVFSNDQIDSFELQHKRITLVIDDDSR
jgi:hypothetical protein